MPALFFLFINLWQIVQLPYQLSVNKELEFIPPATYRNWVWAGANVVPDDLNRSKAIFPGIHNVYIDPDAYKHRQEKGSFPDGTAIVMEVLKVERGESEGGFGYFSTGAMDVLVQVKDRRRFTDSGWAYFMFKDADIKKGKTLATIQEAAMCQSCHVVGAADDEVFTQYYPMLGKKE